MIDRTVNFSVKPEDTLTRAKLKTIKAYCDAKAINFSFLMCQAVALIYKEKEYELRQYEGQSNSSNKK